MPRLRAIHFREVPGVHPDSRFTLGHSANVVFGRGEASGRRALLRWLAAVLSGDFSQTPDAAWALDCTLEEEGASLDLTLRRTGPGAPVELLQVDAEPRALVPPEKELPPGEGVDWRVYTPALRVIDAVGPTGTLRSPRWVPRGLLHARLHAPPGEVVRQSLKYLPELSSLWFHLDYERGDVLLSPGDEAAEGGRLGAVTFALERDGAGTVGVEALSEGQRRLLDLHYFLACQGEVALLDDVMAVIPDEDALRDLLRGLLPGFSRHPAARQGVLGADTSALLYAFGLRSAAAVRECTVLCLPAPDGGGWLWRDMTEEEARRYFQFYEQGFSQIDSLIRLW